MLKAKLSSDEYELQLGVESGGILEGLAQKLAAAPNWANGRDEETRSKKIYRLLSTSSNFGL